MEIDINDKEFGLFQRLIYDESGINLTPAKRELVKSRLMKRLRERSLTSFKEYYTYVTEEDTTGEEMVMMLDCISTNLTEFFREPAHFDFLSKKGLPALLENKRKKRKKASDMERRMLHRRRTLHPFHSPIGAYRSDP